MISQEKLTVAITIMSIHGSIDIVSFNDKGDAFYGNEHIPDGYNIKYTREQLFSGQIEQSEEVEEKQIKKTLKNK